MARAKGGEVGHDGHAMGTLARPSITRGAKYCQSLIWFPAGSTTMPGAEFRTSHKIFLWDVLCVRRVGQNPRGRLEAQSDQLLFTAKRLASYLELEPSGISRNLKNCGAILGQVWIHFGDQTVALVVDEHERIV
jgi:hypothetical protein